MKKRMKKNRKGSVLLTVICFTTVCMLIASLALSLANYSTKVSNNNIRSTQAEITAQNYLQEFISTFETTDPSGGVSYTDLKNIAGTDEAHAKEYAVSISGGSSANVGDCKIYVYNTTSGIVVKSEATYAGETEVASAFFKTKSTPYSSTNAIEVSNGLNGTDNALIVEGDTLIESTNSTDLVYFHNAQAQADGHYYTNCNLLAAKNTDAAISDSIDDVAPTVMTEGYLFWQQCKITTSVGKYDINGNKSADINYDPDKLSNRDGYLYTNKKFIMLGVSGGTIGENAKPIDVYCHGAYLGGVPNTAPDYDDIRSIYSSIEGTNPGASIYGNVYCYKGMNTTSQSGDLYVNFNGGGAKVNGDVIVEGNIYLLGKLTVTGKLYCSGDIYYCNWDGSFSKTASISGTSLTGDSEISSRLIVNGGYSNTLPCNVAGISSIDRSIMPDLDYDPSKYDPTDPTAENPTRNSTSIYQNATPNNMFNAADQSAAKNIKSKYFNAYIYGGKTWDEVTYIDEACNTSLKQYCESSGKSLDDVKLDIINGVSSNKLYINGDYRFDDSEIKDEFKKKCEFIVKMPSTGEDIVIILPNDSSEINISVDFSNSPKDTTVSPNVPKNFCYFMQDGGSTGDNYAGTAVTINEWRFYKTNIRDKAVTNNAEVVSTKDQVNNIFILVPDNCEMYIEADNGKCMQAVVYGPKANVKIKGTGSPQRALVGQLLVKSVNIDNNATSIASRLPSPNSILDFINNSATASVKLEYFTKYKS